MSEVSEAEATLIPTLTDEEMRALYNEGISRIGIVALLADSEGERVLLLEHTASDKSKAGMWGALGETSQVASRQVGWELEAPLDTLARGLQEERKVGFPKLWVPNRVPVFFMEWPVGVDRTDVAYAICPVVILDDEMVQAIEAAPVTDEVSRSVFVPVEQAADGKVLRPGMDMWLPKALDALDANAGAELVSVAASADGLPGQTQDAILEDLYGPRDG